MGAFEVKIGNDANAVTAVAVVGSTVELTLTTAVANGDVVTVGYTDSTAGTDGANEVQDAAGNDAATLAAGTGVTNNVPVAGMTVTAVNGALTLSGTATGDVTIDLAANQQTISQGSIPSGGPFAEVDARTLAGGGIIVTGKNGVPNYVFDSPQADQFTGGDSNDHYHWSAGADVVSGGVQGPGSSILMFVPPSTPEGAIGLVINASSTEKTLASGLQVAGGNAATIAAGKAAWYGTDGAAISVIDQVTFSKFNSYDFDRQITQFFGSDDALDVIYVSSKISASVIDGGTIGGGLALTGSIGNFTNAGGFVVNLSGDQKTLHGSMEIAGGTTKTIEAGKVGLIGSNGIGITNIEQMTVSNLSDVWLSDGDNQVWGSSEGNLFQIFGTKGENYIDGGQGTDSLFLNLTTLPTNATGFAVNLGDAQITLENNAQVAGSSTTTLEAGKLAYIGAAGTDITSTKQDTLVSIEEIHGGLGADQFFGSDAHETFLGAEGGDVFFGGGGVDTLHLNRYALQDSDTDTVLYVKGTDGSGSGDVINSFTAGATNGDILKFIDANNTTGDALDLTGNKAKGFSSGLFDTLAITDADNVWVITDVQADWINAEAIDAAIHTKADAGMTGGLVLVFKTDESADAQVWYLGTAFEGTDGTDVLKLATLVGISDLTTLTTDNFAVV